MLIFVVSNFPADSDTPSPRATALSVISSKNPVDTPACAPYFSRIFLASSVDTPNSPSF